MPDLAELNLVVKSTQVDEANRRLDIFVHLSGRAEAAAGQLGSSVQKQGGVIADLSSKYEKLSRLLVAFAAGAGVAGLALKALQAAGKMEQTEVAFETLLKGKAAGQQMIADLRKFAAETPFEFPEVTAAAKRALALGFKKEEIMPLLKTVGDAASGLGLGGEGMDRMITALGQMRAKGKVSLEEMNQLTESGVSAWEFMAESIGATVPAAMEMVHQGLVPVEKAMKAIEDGMDRTFGGGMEKQSKTLLGLWSNLKDEVGNFLVDIGKAMVDAFDIKGKLKSFTEWLSSIKPYVVEILRDLAGLTPVNKDIAASVKVWVEVIKDAALVLGVIFGTKMLLGAASMLAAVAKLVLQFKGLSVTASPLLTIVLSIGAAMAGWSLGKTIFDQFESVQHAGADFLALMMRTKKFIAGEDTDYIASVQKQLAANEQYFSDPKTRRSGGDPRQLAAERVAYKELGANDYFNGLAPGAQPKQEVDRLIGIINNNASLSGADKDAAIKRVMDTVFPPGIQREFDIRVSDLLAGTNLDLAHQNIDRLQRATHNDIGKDFPKPGDQKDFFEAFKDNALKGMGDLRGWLAEVTGLSSPEVKGAVGGANAVLETNKAKDGAGTDGKTAEARKTTADVYIDSLRRESAALDQQNYLLKYQDELFKLTESLKTEMATTDGMSVEQILKVTEARAALIEKVKQEINLYEKRKVMKDVNAELMSQEKELAILQSSSGRDREARLEVEKLIGKAQQDGINFTQKETDDLTRRTRAIIDAKHALGEMEKAAQKIGDAFGDAFDEVITGAKSMGAAVLDIVRSIEKALIQAFITNPLRDSISGLAGGFLSKLGGGVIPHADGGIVTSPTFFGFGGGKLGVAGEAGDEVIMPVGRGPDGKMGVRGSGGGNNTTVNISVTATDANSFRKSERQIANSVKRAIGG